MFLQPHFLLKNKIRKNLTLLNGRRRKYSTRYRLAPISLPQYIFLVFMPSSFIFFKNNLWFEKNVILCPCSFSPFAKVKLNLSPPPKTSENLNISILILFFI